MLYNSAIARTYKNILSGRIIRQYMKNIELMILRKYVYKMNIYII